jgi:hypothetical protein
VNPLTSRSLGGDFRLRFSGYPFIVKSFPTLDVHIEYACISFRVRQYSIPITLDVHACPP